MKPSQPKARELIASASTSLEKIAALAEFAQDVNYVSIQTGVGRGGGYRPHAAPEVLQNNYGDCKDKANLLRSMLDSLGIRSYPVAIYSSDRSFVREEWASPQQFNHAILAIAVEPDTDLPAAKDYDNFGRLLFFDPTDPHTPFGQMPEDEQDAWALLVAPESGGLIRTPSTAPEDNLLDRTVEVTLTEDGAIVAALREECFGDSASYNRALHNELAPPDYRKVIERWGFQGRERRGRLQARRCGRRRGLHPRHRIPGGLLCPEHGRAAARLQAGCRLAPETPRR